ncbi:MAG: hypothetical protein IJ341_05245 [Bacteroidales bacterium]|nr:hypothetical protein [Bacteroidales bacterium]MBQ7819083.1 hypothetical protein [Bacteroidales bacterium]
MKHLYYISIIFLFIQLFIKIEVKAINNIVCSIDTCASSRITNSGDSLIIATSNTIVSFNKNEYSVKTARWYSENNLLISPPLSTTIDEEGKIWYSDMYSLYCVDQESCSTDVYPFDNILFYSYSIQNSSNGDIWIGGARNFYIRKSNGEIKILTNPFDELNTISVMSNIEEDSEGNMWTAITSYGAFNGYNIVYYDKLYNHTVVSTKDNDQVHTMQIDKNDNIWFASSEGISCINKDKSKKVYSFNDNPKFGNDFYVASSKDNAGNIWFSSSSTLIKYNGTEFISYTSPNYSDACSILCDGDIVWVLLKNDKLLKFQNNEFETIDLSPAVTGIEESKAEESNTKAYVSNGVLYIENDEGINSVEVYEATGRVITSGSYNSNSIQIQLPATINGVILVKVNSEVVKTIVE